MVTESWPAQVRRRRVGHLTVLTVVAVNSCCCILSHTMPRPVWQRGGGWRRREEGFGFHAVGLNIGTGSQSTIFGSRDSEGSDTVVRELRCKHSYPPRSQGTVTSPLSCTCSEKIPSPERWETLGHLFLCLQSSLKSYSLIIDLLLLPQDQTEGHFQSLTLTLAWKYLSITRQGRPFGAVTLGSEMHYKDIDSMGPLPDHRSLVLRDLSAQLEGLRRYPNSNQGYRIGWVCGDVARGDTCSLQMCLWAGCLQEQMFPCHWWELPAASWHCYSPTQALPSPKSTGNSCWPSFASWIFPDKGGEVSENSVILSMNSKFWKQ